MGLLSLQQLLSAAGWHGTPCPCQLHKSIRIWKLAQIRVLAMDKNLLVVVQAWQTHKKEYHRPMNRGYFFWRFHTVATYGTFQTPECSEGPDQPRDLAFSKSSIHVRLRPAQHHWNGTWTRNLWTSILNCTVTTHILAHRVCVICYFLCFSTKFLTK
jgi:hypothetical protein